MADEQQSGDQPSFYVERRVGLTPDIAYLVSVSNLVEGPVTAALYPGATVPGCPTTTGALANTVTAWTDAPLGIPVGQQLVITNATGEGGGTTPPGYAGTWQITCVATGSAMSGHIQFKTGRGGGIRPSVSRIPCGMDIPPLRKQNMGINDA